MLLHKLLQDVLLLLIFTRRQTHFLLPLIVHHLLDQAARFARQIGQLGRFRIDFLRRNGRIVNDQAIPPRHLIEFLERQHNNATLECPQRVLFFHLSMQRSIDDGRCILQADFQVFLLQLNDDITGPHIELDAERDFELGVWRGGTKKDIRRYYSSALIEKATQEARANKTNEPKYPRK